MEYSWEFFTLDYCNPVASHLYLSLFWWWCPHQQMMRGGRHRNTTRAVEWRKKGGRKSPENDWRCKHIQHSHHRSNKHAAPLNPRRNLAVLLFNIHEKEHLSEKTIGTSPQLHFCPFQHQNRLISAIDVKGWQSEELIKDWYVDLVPIRHWGRALCLIAALFCRCVPWNRKYAGTVEQR